MEEHEYHFKSELKRLIYFYKEEDENLIRLRKYFETTDVETRFSKSIPDDLQSHIIKDHTTIVIDDRETFFSTRENAETLYYISSVLVSHLGLTVFFTVNSFGGLRKDNVLNKCILNSTHLIFFKCTQEGRSIKNFMQQFELQLKSDLTLWAVYQKYIQRSNSRFSYLFLCVSPKSVCPTAYSNILMASDGPLVSYHLSDDDE